MTSAGLTVTLYVPSAATGPDPIGRPPATSVNVAASSARPVKVGVVSLVTLSVFDVPVSLSGVRSGTSGTGGAAVSMVTSIPPDSSPSLPCASTALAVIEYVPSARSAVTE